MDNFIRDLLKDALTEHNQRVADILKGKPYTLTKDCENVFLEELADMGGIEAVTIDDERVYRRIID